RLAIGLQGGAARVIDIGLRKAPEVEIKGHQGTLYTIVFSPDGNSVLTAGGDGAARVWSATSGELQSELIGSGGEVINAVFSPDQKRIATARSDGVARIWDAATRQVVQQLAGHSGRIY